MQPSTTVETSLPTYPAALSATFSVPHQTTAGSMRPLFPDVATRSTATAAPGVCAPLTAAQEETLLRHLPMVRFVARSIAERLPQHVELEELVGAGTLGLVDAVRKFSPLKNVQFRSYAQFRVRGAILDSLRSLDWSPRELRRQSRQLAEVKRQLEGRLGRPPQEGEVALAMNLSLRELQELAGQLRGLEIASLNADLGHDSGEEEMTLLPGDERENPLTQYLDGEARERLAEAIAELPERERTVVTLYYYEELTMREIGSVLGIVESRVSQLNHAAMKRLRRSLADISVSGRKPVAMRGDARSSRAC